MDRRRRRGVEIIIKKMARGDGNANELLTLHRNCKSTTRVIIFLLKKFCRIDFIQKNNPPFPHPPQRHPPHPPKKV